MKNIINTTPHLITMIDSEGTVYSIPSHCLLNAKAIETKSGFDRFGNELVKTSFVASAEAIAQLEEIEKENPESIIIGSIIAAQAFPGRVYAMIPAPGFERVAPNEKRMRDDKFTIF